MLFDPRMEKLIVGLVVAVVGVSALSIVDHLSKRRAARVAADSAANHRSDAEPQSTTPQTGWPFIRGPNFDGHSAETDLADRWPSQGPPVLWTRTLGQGYSAFVAQGSRIYTQYQSLSGQYVVCLDADSGATVWEHRYDWPYEAAGVYPGPRATPTLAGGRIFFAGPSGLVGCLSETGEKIWSVNVMEKFRGRGTDFGYSCSPVVDAGIVLVPAGGTGGAMLALDVRDGSVVWHSGDDSASYTPAFPITVDGHQQVLGYLENVLTAYDRHDGRKLWRLQLSQGYDEHAAWPVYVEPYLWISAPFRSGSQLLKLTGGENASVETVWNSRLLSNDVCSSVHHDGGLYGFDLRDVQAKTHRPSKGHFRCLDFLTGEQRWETDRTGQASVLIADGKLILFNDKGELILARASPERYDELARAQVFEGEICWTSPALDRRRLYLRTQSQAACIYLGRPEQLDRERTAPALTVADIPRGVSADLAVLLGVEPEYAFDVPSLRWLRDWFLAGLAILALAAAGTGAANGVVLLLRRRSISPAASWAVFRVASFILGATTMTPLSLWRNEFVFTWPVSLFVVFHATLFQVRLRRNESNGDRSRWAERTVLAAFLGVCVVYYLLCRRLSLVFEWGFLFGFVAAAPIGLAERWLSRRGKLAWLTHVVLLPLGFAVYYWASVSLLFMKYTVP